MKTLLVIMLSVFTFTAQAADDYRSSSMKKPNMFTSEYKPSIGILAGMETPEGDTRDDEATIGLDLGYSPKKDDMMLGLEYSYSRIGSGDNEDKQNTVLLKAGYKFGGDTTFVKDSWVALGAGALLTDDDTLAVASPMVGFDIPVTSQDTEYITLGASARYNFIENINGANNDTATINGAVKYWY